MDDQVCKNCSHHQDKLRNPNDPLAGTYKACEIERRNPTNRYVNQESPCRFNPSRWSQK